MDTHTTAEWEMINSSDGYTSRMPVVGGWLVRVISYASEAHSTIALAFISDPDHLWQVDEPGALPIPPAISDEDVPDWF